MGDFIDIGPECFAMPDETVISWKGENFYKACNAFVTDRTDGGQSFCVRRVDHPDTTHQDFDGNVRDV